MGNKSSSKTHELKSSSYPKNGYPVMSASSRFEPIARVLLMGVYDDNNPLSKFRGMRYLMKEIWNLAMQFNKHYYSPYIEVTDQNKNRWGYNSDAAFISVQYLAGCGEKYNGDLDPYNLKFPEPLGKNKEININMMPIKMDQDANTLKKQLPKELQRYLKFILICLRCDPSQQGKICYLTIHESFVEKGKTQRRPGLHIECPGNGNGDIVHDYAWGGGRYAKDGLFMASNIAKSCAIWNCRIIQRDDREIEEVIGALGNIEHLRRCLPKNKRITMRANGMYWCTDRTPHESLPMEESGYRQFFRLVSSNLSVWYPKHSTPNPIGTVPDEFITRIDNRDKFKK